MPTLYRQYRPQKFSDLVGQNHVKITLEHEIGAERTAHAYLFCGPRGIGKTTVARVLAKAINCSNRKKGEHEPCDQCDSCKDITIGRSLDILEIDAASHTGVDNVRENIIAVSRIAPSREKHKVFIIDEIHMLSTAAFNALLKVLEEPPANVVFVLCTTEVHKIPTTIISRCQRFDFKRIAISEIVKKLQFIANNEKIKIDIKILKSIARHSEGHMRDAESLLGQVVAIGGREITAEEADLVIPRSDFLEAIHLIGFIAKRDAGHAIELVNKLVDEGLDLKRFLSDLIEFLRKIMLVKINPTIAEKVGIEVGEEFEKKIIELSRGLDLNYIVAILEKFIEVKNSLKGSFIAQLPAEIAIVELCSYNDGNNLNTAKASNSAPGAPSAGGQSGSGNNNKVSKGAPEYKSSSITTAEINSGKIDKKQLLSRWHEVLAKVKKYNHSLSFILRVCEPRDIKGKQLCLAFKYKFHKDRVGDVNIKKLVEKVLNEVYGQPLLVEAIVDENLDVQNGNGYESALPDAANAAFVAEPDAAKKDSGDKAGAKPAAETSKSEKEIKPEVRENNMVNNLLKTFGGKVINP